MAITSIEQLDKNALYTYADYLTWQFDQMVELIRGKLYILSPAPAFRHQQISAGINAFVLPYFMDKQCNAFHAPFDVRLMKGKQADKDILTVVQPDICVICDDAKFDAKGCIGAPDWIIEIISPSTAKKDYNEKFNLYEENAVREYWIVNPDANSINQFVLQEDGKFSTGNIFYSNQIVQPAIFPDLHIDLKQVFK